jgi:lysylphosphatidylglycerol synthetase-like protein (DUF2156 family)
MILNKFGKLAVTLVMVSALILPALLLPETVRADCNNGNYSVGTGINCGNTGGVANSSVESVVQSVINVAMWAVGIIAVVIIIVAGIMYATAAGDEAKVKKAKNALIGGIIGLAIALLAFVIAGFVRDVATD